MAHTQVGQHASAREGPSGDAWRSLDGRAIDPEDLVSADVIAERLRLPAARLVNDWVVHLQHFPRAVARNRHRLWYWPAVRSWAVTHRDQLARVSPLPALLQP